MKTNIGTPDRIIRIILGIVLIALPFVSGLTLFDAGWARVAAIIVGLVLIVTALVRSCPLYTVLGMRTCPRR